jgi:hypothetical protein
MSHNPVPSGPPLPILTVRLARIPILAAILAFFVSAADAQPAGGIGGTLPTITETQMYRFAKELNTDFLVPNLAVTNARIALAGAALAIPSDEAAIAARAADLAQAEFSLASLKADAFANIQASTDRLSREQAALLVANGGRYSPPGGLGGNVQPMDFADREGYVPIFDGVSLAGWDGNPKFWRVEDGAIVGESTPANPSGNNYLVYREVQAHDFNLKFEVKVDANGGTGLQYRSRTGIPWLAGINDNVVRNVGPVNLDWMQTGPQADFWPSQPWTGQFYSENTVIRILARRGQVVESFGNANKRILGSVGDPAELQALIKPNDWNEYQIIARGPVCIHIINGQVMSVMIDDDPESSNNWSGEFGIEIEATTKVYFRNLWLKRLN